MSSQKKIAENVFKKGERGYVAENVARIAEAFLKKELTASLSDIYSAVHNESREKGLDINVCTSRLKVILIARKRKFSFMQTDGENEHLTHGEGAMYNLLKSINDKMEEAAKQRRSQEVDLARSNLRYLHTAPRTSHEGSLAAKRA